MKIGIVIGVVIAILALVVCLVPVKEVTYTVTVDYQGIETYCEDEPYEAVESYTELVPLDYEVIKSYVENDTINEHRQIIIGGVVFQDEIVEIPIQVACVDVRNIDTIAGTFTVAFVVAEPLFGNIPINLEVNPSETKTASCPADNLGNWSYNITPSTKTIEKERTVTKYRQVEKERTVTKQRPETRYKKVTVLDYLFHY